MTAQPAGSDHLARVRVTRRVEPHRHHVDRTTLCTSRFCATRSDGRLEIEHDLRPDEMSDELALLVAAELDDTGILDGQDEFEAVFTGIVASTEDMSAPPWLRFYRNSVTRLEHGVAAFAPVHEHAASLVSGSQIVDLGSCFGFFPLRLADSGFEVLATDLSAPTMNLLSRIGPLLQRPLTTLCCDAAHVPLTTGFADTVTVLHLLEHLTTDAIHAVATEALRLARHRVVIAVPYEDVPRACYGHLQRFDTARLRRLGDRLRTEHPGLRGAVHEFHGGWLILDR